MNTRCVSCDQPTVVVDGRSARRRYCSTACRNLARNQKYAANPRPRKPRLSLEDRFRRRLVRMPNGCLEWTGSRGRKGYGQIGRGARCEGLIETHRLAWELANGEPVPPGMVVRHHCDNPPCCEPSHLAIGTHADNSQDKVSRGRQAVGEMLPHTKLSADDVRAIRDGYVRQFGPPKLGGRRSNARELAEQYGVSTAYVMQLVHGHFRKGVA